MARLHHPIIRSEVVLDSRGGRVGGQVVGPDGDVWSGANLMLVPDPFNGRLQSYREGSADEYGQFKIRGVAPGKYTLLAWLDELPCDPYDADGLRRVPRRRDAGDRFAGRPGERSFHGEAAVQALKAVV